MEYGLFFIIAACVIGFLMAWGIGANDLANIMSTALGSKAISISQAIIIAIIFEFAGAFFGGLHVTKTLSHGIIAFPLFAHQPQILVHGMLAALTAGMCWMLFASYIGMPVSITNTIVGAIVGFGTIVLGPHAIYWKTISYIALSWIFSPILAGILAYFLFITVKRLILATNDPSISVKKYIPYFFFLVGIVLTIMGVLKDLFQLGYHPALWQDILIIIGISSLVTFVGMYLCSRIYISPRPKRYQKFNYTEKLFGILMAFTACAMVFAHGSNDIAVAVGPIISILSIVKYFGQNAVQNHNVLWIIFMGCSAVVLGLLMYGRKVIATVGENITELTPSRAFSATLGAAITVILSTSSGIPVSATQTLVGGVLGVGLARGLWALDLSIIRNVILSWIITVPAAALLAIIFFYLINFIF